MKKTILGIERVDEFKELFEGKRVGLITNPTGIDSNFKSSIDILLEKTNLVALFSPEHGVRADIQAGMKLDTYIDQETNLPVYSLYGKNKKPTEEMMNQLDIMSIDVQDCGSRYYTFIYTMVYSMMACQEYNKTFVVFDRPNPIGGEKVEGNILDIKYRSFVGYYPIVQRHGMTIGELAKLFNEEFGIGCNLVVIPMKNYERWMSFEDTHLPWVVPTPNLPTINTAYTYNTTCVFEGTNVAEGRGTTTPFELVGAPWIKSEKLARDLNKYNLPGVYFRPQYFTPTFSKYQNELCGGVFVHVTDRKTFNSMKTSWVMLEEIRRNYKEFVVNKPYVEGRPSLFEFEVGCDYMIDQRYSLEEELELLDQDAKKFEEIRKPYLIY
ncbi:MAG: DUF1343 domain-containing protein [Bacilli bacterium]|nr:DUF1343 domain-containing protein [Bacilli bacterium]